MENEKNIKEKEIRDDEIRIIGSSDRPKPEVNKSGWKKVAVWVLGLILVAAVILFAIFYPNKKKVEPEVVGVFEEQDSTVVETKTEPVEKLGNYSDSSSRAFVEILNRTINDVPLTIYIPHNATPELLVGTPNILDTNIIFLTHAADIRRDNKKIVGAFVTKGEPLAWGLSKKGYCAILEGVMTIGVAEDSPLFEKATVSGGDFFRQYPLVDEGKLVENEPKNKSYRRALCERAGEFFIVITDTNESFHDFAQALVDLGVKNAIYLVGGDSYGFYRGLDGKANLLAKPYHHKYKYENYILWRRTNE